MVAQPPVVLAGRPTAIMVASPTVETMIIIPPAATLIGMLERVVRQPVERAVQQPVERAVQQPVERVVQQPVERVVQQPVERVVQAAARPAEPRPGLPLEETVNGAVI